MFNKRSVELPLLLLMNCSNVFIQDSVFTCHSEHCRLSIVDVFKVVTLHNISSDYLIIWHNESISDGNTTVTEYTGQNTESNTFAILIKPHQHDYNIKILLSQVNVNAISLTCMICKGTNYVKLERKPHLQVCYQEII